MHNELKSNEWRRIWVHRTFKIEIQKGGPNNSDILQNWFPLEIRSPLLNLQKFENPERSTSESYKMDSKLINGEEFGSKKHSFKIEIQKGVPNNSDILQKWFPQELGPPLFNL